MIEGTAIAGEFKCIYACSFYYGEQGNAVWPAQSVNYTNKTQFLFRIEKGILNVYDQRVNDHFQPSDMRVPFSHIIYIGDSDTDVPCMKLVNEYGGYSVGVYDPDTGDKTKVLKIYKDGRISLFAPADYSENKDIDKMIKAIISKISVSELLDKYCMECKDEASSDQRSDKEITQDALIAQLEESDSFIRTHHIIKQCNSYPTWSHERIVRLCDAAKNNSQISFLLQDTDVKYFYERIISKADMEDPCCKYVLQLIENDGDVQ